MKIIKFSTHCFAKNSDDFTNLSKILLLFQSVLVRKREEKGKRKEEKERSKEQGREKKSIETSKKKAIY